MNANSPQKTIISQIIAKKTLKDKWGKDYLLLEIQNKEAIFVFAGKTDPKKWNKLEENKSYEFVVEEGNNGSNILVDFYGKEDEFEFLI